MAHSNREIERKFLLDEPPEGLNDRPGTKLRQGYIVITEDGTEVRLRKEGKRHFLTIKDDHDLAVLRQVLSGSGDMSCDCSPLEMILPLIERRRADLQRDAFALGRIIYGGRPKVFVVRLGAFWRAWTSEAETAEFDPR